MPSLITVRESAEDRFRAIFGAGRTPNVRAAAGFVFTHHVVLGSGDLYMNIDADGDMHSRVPFLWFEEDGQRAVYEKNIWYWRNDIRSSICNLGVILHENSYSGPHGLEYRATHQGSGFLLSVATSGTHVSVFAPDGTRSFCSRSHAEISDHPIKAWSELLAALAG